MSELNKKIDLLFNSCKAEVYITYNENKSDYQSIAEFIDNVEDLDNIEPDIYNEMIARDRMIIVQFYPVTPIGCYIVYHYDLESAIDECLRILSEHKLLENK